MKNNDTYKVEFNFGLLKDFYGEGFLNDETIPLTGEKIIHRFFENNKSKTEIILSLDLMYDHPESYDDKTKKLLKSIKLERLFEDKGLLLDLNGFEKLPKIL